MHEVYENRVRFEETDAQGIVFYGNYATYQDETVTRFMEALGFPFDEDRDWDVHVVDVQLSYRGPATFHERLTNAMRVSHIGKSSVTFDYECRNEAGEILVEGSVVHVFVDESGEPTRVPDDFRDAVAAFQDEPPA